MATDDTTQPGPRTSTGSFRSLPADLGSYRLLEAIGEGGMAEVYRALDTRLKRKVAIKVLKDSHLRRPTVLARFLREARSVAKLSHPHVVTIHEAGEFEGRPFLVMEHVEGEPLDRYLEAGRGALDDRLAILAKVARGVEAAHRAGVVHRDLKPANVLVGPGGEPKVVDFGLAHLEQGGTALTRSEAVLGTPRYMAPEQVRGGGSAIGPWTDVHALGTILYEIASGQQPFAGDTHHEVYARILGETPRPLARLDASIPAALDRIARVALAKDPADRYRDAGAFADDLERFLSGQPVLARPATPFGRLWKRSRAVRFAAIGAPVAVLLAGIVAAGVTLGPGRETAVEVASAVEAAPLRGSTSEMAEVAGRVAAATNAASADLEAAHREVERAVGSCQEAIGRDPGHAAAHHVLGALRRDQGRLDEAEAACREALRLDPGLAPAAAELGRVLLDRALAATLRTGREEEETHAARVRRAGEAAREALAPGAEGPVAREAVLAGALAVYGDAEAVRRIAAEGLARFRDVRGSEAFHVLEHLATTGAESDAALERALRLRPGFALALVLRSSRRYRARDLEGALADGEAAIRAAPWFAEAHLHRGLLRAERGDLEGAFADYAKALELRPGFVAAIVNRANARYRSGDRKGALADYDLAIATDPDDVDARHNRGIARLAARDARGALADFDHLVRIRPRLAEAWFERGNARLELDEHARAIGDYDEAIRLDPDYAKPYLNRGNARADLGDTAGAFADYDAALARDPNLLEAHFNRGNLCRDLGRIDEAIEEFTKVLSIDPRFAAAIYNRGNIHRARGDHARALADYTETVRLQPKFFSGWFNRGACHLALGDLQAAIRDYTEALRIDPRQPDAWHNRGLARDAAGDREGGIADLTKALEVAPSSWEGRSRTVRLLAEMRSGR